MLSFAMPRADAELEEKIIKLIRCHMKRGDVCRGVNAVTKRVSSLPVQKEKKAPIGLVAIASDVSPADFVSHIPALCAERGIACVYVSGRNALSVASKKGNATPAVYLDSFEETADDDLKAVIDAYNDFRKHIR